MVRVFSHWLSPRKAAFFVAEEAVLVLALLAGASIAPVAHPWVTAESGLAPAFIRAAISAVAFAGALYFGDLYDLRAAAADRADGRRLMRALGVAMIVMAVAYLVLPRLVPLGILARRSLVLAEAGGAFAVILVRAFMPAVVGPPLRILFLGNGPRARQLARDIGADGDGLFEVVGFTDPAARSDVSALSLIGPLPQLVRHRKVQVLVVAVEDRRIGLPVDELLECRTHGVRVMSDVGFAEATLKRIPLELVRPSAFIFDEGFSRSALGTFMKRAGDLGIAIAMLVVLSPLMIAAALAILISDGRPVFYSQERIGRDGHPYRIWKFRTMRRDAERMGAVFAKNGDPRVLAVGRFFRRSRIDELPQLWNVVRGDMSMVGPRPERPEFLQQLKERYPLFAMRELVQPGLTGWAQLKYGYGSSIEEMGRKLEYDLYYIKNTSLFLDLVCLFHTAKVVVLGKGAR
ncbi:MAG TPA: TIGR03013 family XrtA/PEP-CTERM system glycosyltransferase [Anaeromyxobacteraceae bacterium]|nr:TIGR03013 family XrtA/PEP-CTERM system glycosyltransferase [Anaeromyxobacteraceae bacterium]